MKGKKVFLLNKRLYIYFIAVVMLFAIIITSLIVNTDDGRISLYYSPSKNGAVVLTNGKDTGSIVPGKSISCVRYNSDFTSCSVLMSDGATFSLYNVHKENVKKVADGCTSDFVHSFKGEESVYITADGYLCSENVTIDEAVDAFAVSPDCSAVIYSKKDDNVSKLYLYMSGKTTLVSENYSPLAVSEGGEYLYVLSGDNSLCILSMDGSMQSKICSDVQTDYFWFSDDLNSVVFSDGAYTYISVSGKSRVRLIPGKASPVLSEADGIRLNSTGTAFICNDDNLTDIFYSADSDNGTKAVFYVNDDCGRADIAVSVKKFVITGNDSLSYLDTQGKIYKYNGDESELVVSGASDFDAASDNKYIYYMTTAHELYAVKGNKTQLITTDAQKICMNSSDELMLIMTDKSLYSVSGTRLGDIIASDVSFCTVDSDITFFATGYNDGTGTFELHSSVLGRKFRLAAEEVIKS